MYSCFPVVVEDREGADWEDAPPDSEARFPMTAPRPDDTQDQVIGSALTKIRVFLLAPWRRSAFAEVKNKGGRQVAGWFAGLLLCPAPLVGVALGERLKLPEKALPAFPPPQAGLTAALSKAIVRASLPPVDVLVKDIGLLLAAWLVGGFAAGFWPRPSGVDSWRGSSVIRALDDMPKQPASPLPSHFFSHLASAPSHTHE